MVTLPPKSFDYKRVLTTIANGNDLVITHISGIVILMGQSSRRISSAGIESFPNRRPFAPVDRSDFVRNEKLPRLPPSHCEHPLYFFSKIS